MRNEVTGEVMYIAVDIQKALTFDLVEPIEMTGEAETHECNIEISMTNGDAIEFKYYGSPRVSMPDTTTLTINGITTNIETDDPTHEIRGIYKNHLLQKLRA